MVYEVSERSSVELPPDFHPTLSVESSVGNIFLTDGVRTKCYEIEDDAITQKPLTENITQVTCMCTHNSGGTVTFGQENGQIRGFHPLIFSIGHVIFTEEIEDNNPVTAIHPEFIAHGRVVSKLGESEIIRNRYDKRLFEYRVTVPGNDSVTMLHVHNGVLYCFARNRIFLYDRDNYLGQADVAGTVDSVLCVFQHPGINQVLMVYPTGIYKMPLNDPNTFRQVRLFDQQAVSACQFGNYFAVVWNYQMEVYKLLPVGFVRVFNNTLNYITRDLYAGSYLCAPHEGNEFNLITRSRIHRLSISEREETDVSSDEESSSYEVSEDEEEPIPDEEKSIADEERVGWESGVGMKRGRTEMSEDVIKTMQLECEWLADPDNEEKERKYREARANLTASDEGFFQTQHKGHCLISFDKLFEDIDEDNKHEYRFAGEEVVVLDCGHMFHKSSLEGLRNSNRAWICPLCRSHLKRHRALAQILLI